MDPTQAPAATTDTSPAAPPAAQSAVEAAVSKSPSEYRAAKRAERAGKPLADVPVTAAKPGDPNPAAPTAENRKTRAEKDQDRINESIRAASAAAEAPLKTRIAELEAQLHRTPPAETARPAAEPAADVAPEKKTPEYKRIMALAGAPKLADFDSVEEHAFAAAEFIDTVRTTERESTARNRASVDALLASEKAADDAFFDQLDKAKTADPEFAKKVAPHVLALTPVEWLPRDKDGRPIDEHGRLLTTGPLNVVASELRKSPVVRDLMLHFSQHPAELAKFAEMPPAVAAIANPRARLHAHITHIVREFHRLEGRFTAGAAVVAAEPEPKTISDAPDPAPVLGSRPVETGDPITKAVKRGDTRAYRELRRQERAAGRR